MPEVYQLASPGCNCRFSVPVLFDLTTSTIVNNESSELIVMLNNEFNAVAANPELDLYPKQLRLEVDAVNEWVGKCINAGKLQRQFCFHGFLPSCEAMFLKICFRSVCCRVCKGARQI